MEEEQELNNHKKNRLSLVNDFDNVEDEDIDNDINDMDTTSFMDVLNSIPENMPENTSDNVPENTLYSTPCISYKQFIDKKQLESITESNTTESAIDNLNSLVSNLNGNNSESKPNINSSINSGTNTSDNSSISNSRVGINLNQGMPYIYINNSSNITIQFSK